MWTPPLDPDRPNCPYVPGFSVKIHAHNPPPPFGRPRYPRRLRTAVPHGLLETVTQSELVLAYPPLDTDPPSEPATAEILVTKIISIGNARGAQLVVCTVSNKSGRRRQGGDEGIEGEETERPFTAVAKIFDPLYYPFSVDIVSSPLDVVHDADVDYSIEAASYECLREMGQTGVFAPNYFGSWTFRLPISREGKAHQRPVRLVLIEHLDASCMQDLVARNRSGPYAEPELDAFHYTKEFRLEVLARILDGVVNQYKGGLWQKDLAPRNVILAPTPAPPGNLECFPRVVLADYNIAHVDKWSDRPQNVPMAPNPIDWFWNDSFHSFAGWIPPEWYTNPNLRREWLLHRFGGERLSLYRPISANSTLSRAEEE